MIKIYEDICKRCKKPLERKREYCGTCSDVVKAEQEIKDLTERERLFMRNAPDSE